MKIIKKLYGGDARNKSQLAIGDVLIMNLLEEAVSLLLKKQKFMDYFRDEDFPQSFEIKIPISQLRNLGLEYCSFMFQRFFTCVPIHQYEAKGRIQETIVKSGTKQINIYTTIK